MNNLIWIIKSSIPVLHFFLNFTMSKRIANFEQILTFVIKNHFRYLWALTKLLKVWMIFQTIRTKLEKLSYKNWKNVQFITVWKVHSLRLTTTLNYNFYENDIFNTISPESFMDLYGLIWNFQYPLFSFWSNYIHTCQNLQ